MPKLPLHLVLTILFLVQIVGLLGLAGYVCYQSGQPAVDRQAVSRQLIQSPLYQDDSRADWHIVIIGPKAEVMAEIHAKTTHIALWCCFALVSTTVTSALVARWITKPIARLKQASDALAQGTWPPLLSEDIVISDLKAVTCAFNQAATQVRQSFTRIQERLAESEEKFTTVFRASPDPIAIFSLAEGTFLEINDRVIEFYAYSRDELMGRTAIELGLWADLDDAVQFKYLLETDGRVANMEVSTYQKSGKMRVVLLSAERCVLQGQDAAMVVIRDISDRKQTEIALRRSELTFATIFRDSPQPAWTATLAEGRCLDANDSFGKVLGYTCNEVIGKTCVELGLWNDVTDLHHFRDMLTQTGKIDNFEVVFRTRSGEVKTVLLSARVSRLDAQDCVIGVLSDITDRKQVEEALRQSRTQLQEHETFLRSIYEGVAMGIFVVDVTEQGEFRVVGLNPAHQQQIGLDLVGRTPEEAQIPAWEAVTQHYQECVAAGSFMSYEESVVLEGQETCWYTTLTPLKNPDGQIYRIIGTTLNITSLKQIEAALRQSETRFLEISEASPAAIYIIVRRRDGSFYFEYISQAIEIIHGLPVQEILDDAAILLDCIRPDDRADYDAAVQRSQETMQPFQHVWRIIAPSGAIKWFQGSSRPKLRETGEVAWYGVVIDITERKQAETALQESEARYRILSDITPVAIFRFDSLLNCIYVNDRWSEMTGRPKESAMGWGWIETLHPDERDGLLDQWTDIQPRPSPRKPIFIQSEGRYLRPDGNSGWYYVQVAQETDVTGTVIGYIGALTDITTRKQAEAALQQAKQQLESHIVDLNQRNREMVVLSEMSDLLQACLTAEEAYATLPNLLKPLFPDCSGSIFIINASRDRIKHVSAWGEHVHSEMEFGLNDCWALRRGRMHVIEQERAGLRCHHIAKNTQIATTLCIPMIAQGETLGLFYLNTETRTALSAAKQQIARTVAEQIALAIANLNLRKTLQQQSIRDPLTGLFNRHYLDETLTHEIARAQHHQHPIGIIMLDIDHFKQFNDTYGHDAGDYVLQTVATLLKNMVQGADIACRYGGEEMILILPETSLEETRQRAEQIRAAIAQFTVSYHGRYLGSLTVSLGVAGFPQHGTIRIAVVQAADVALYRAKANGRNQVVVAL